MYVSVFIQKNKLFLFMTSWLTLQIMTFYILLTTYVKEDDL